MDWFKTFEEACEGEQVDDIFTLTKTIMETAEYTIVDEKNKYNKPFDNKLLSIWIVYNKPRFIKEVSNHPEAQEYMLEIIYETVKYFFDNVNIEKYDEPAILISYIKAIISSAVKRYVKYHRRRTGIVHDEFTQSGKYKGYTYESMLDYLDDINFENDIDLSYSNEMITQFDEVKDMIKDDELAVRLLNSFLKHNGRTRLYEIDKYLDIPVEERTDEMKKRIADAYNKISYATSKVFNKPKEDDKKPDYIHFSDEGEAE